MTYERIVEITNERHYKGKPKQEKVFRSYVKRFMDRFGKEATDPPGHELIFFSKTKEKFMQNGWISEASAAPFFSRIEKLRQVALETAKTDKAAFAKLLEQKLAKRGIGRSELARRVREHGFKCHNETINNWINGKSLPSRSSVARVRQIEVELDCVGELEPLVPGDRRAPKERGQGLEKWSSEQHRKEKEFRELLWKLKDNSGKKWKEISTETALKVDVLENWKSGNWSPTKKYLKNCEALDKALNANGALAKLANRIAGLKPTRKETFWLPYNNGWPEPLKWEWRFLIGLKQDPNLSPARALWRSQDGVDEVQKTFNRFFGALMKVPTPGLGQLTKDDLTFGLCAYYPAFETYVKFATSPNGAGPEGISVHYKTLADRFLHLIRDDAFLGLRKDLFITHPTVKRILPTKMPDPSTESDHPVKIPGAQAEIELKTPDQQFAGLRWMTRKKLNEFKRNTLFHRKTLAEKAMPMVKHERELPKYLREGARTLIRETPARIRTGVAWALHIKKTLLYLIMITRAFRRRTLKDLDVEHFKFKGNGEIHFDIPSRFFKVRDKGGSKGGVTGPIPPLDELKTIVTIYIHEARPILLQHVENTRKSSVADGSKKNSSDTGQETTCLFISDRGRPMTSKGLFALARRATDQAVGLQLGPHCFRYIMATAGKRKGLGTNTVAAMLTDTDKMVQEMYDKTCAADRNDEANRGIQTLYAGT